MAAKGNSGTGVWWRVAEFADRQHGVVSRDQLRAAGLGESGIARALAGGHLFPLFRGTFAVGRAEVGRLGRLRAATLAGGDGTVLSHGSAAALLGLSDRSPYEVNIIAPVEAGRKITGIRRRYAPPPRLDERWLPENIPCTSPSRTIVDLAGECPEWRLAGIVEEAAVQRLLDVAEIDAILRHGPRRRGSPKLRLILDDWRRYPKGLTILSRMEARLLPMLTRRRVPAPACNAIVRAGGRSFTVDFLWRRERLIVETDGGQFHDNPAAEMRDGERDRLLARAGYRIRRLRWDDLTRRPEATINEILRLLDAR